MFKTYGKNYWRINIGKWGQELLENEVNIVGKWRQELFENKGIFYWKIRARIIGE